MNVGVYNDPPNAHTVPAVYPTRCAVQTPAVIAEAGRFSGLQRRLTSAISLSSVKSATRTLMLAERVFVDPANRHASGRNGRTAVHGDTAPSYPLTAANVTGFRGRTVPAVSVISPAAERLPTADSAQHPDRRAVRLGNDAYCPPLSSPHPGIVIVTFCDGHAESLPDTTLCYNDPDNPAIYVLP